MEKSQVVVDGGYRDATYYFRRYRYTVSYISNRHRWQVEEVVEFQ